MASNTREDPFESLGHEPSYVPREVFIIPSQFAEGGYAANKDGFSILSLKYNINNKCFEKEDRKIVKSLFFELLRKIPKNINANDFLTIKFNERQVDDLTIERDQIVENLLRKGVTLNGDAYNIIGCSNSQVQKKSFLFMKGSRDDCDRQLDQLINVQDLQHEKGVAKRVKYTGLLFTGCQFIAKLPNGYEEKNIQDRESDNGKYNFTDGCGMLSLKLAKEIARANPSLKTLWKGEIPSIWQIRYYGRTHLCKGVLIVDYTNDTTSVLSLRKSLKKVRIQRTFKWNEMLLGIVDTNLNSNFGKLNKQVITLLSETMKNDLLMIQEEYIKGIIEARFEAKQTVKMAALMGQWSNVKTLLQKRGLQDILPKNYTSLVQSIEASFIKAATKEDSESLFSDRIQIPLASSRLLFGAAYPEVLHTKLKETQCIVFTENGFHEGPVIVSRSPSYSPGDIRILEALAPPNGLEMHNVILFATQGSRPDPDKMSGGDLDGDRYLVIWDKRLLKYTDEIKKEDPFDFQTTGTSKRKQNTEDWLSYIAKWENSLLGQIDSCFYNLAETHGVNSQECRNLCKLFSRAVDQVPEDMHELKIMSSRNGGVNSKRHRQFIHKPDNQKPLWEKMQENVSETVEELQNKREKFPTPEDWHTFYSSMVHVDKSEVDDLLKFPEVMERIDDVAIDQVRAFWHMICKGKIPLKPAKIDGSSNCSYDCDIEGCSNIHSEDPEFYKEKWKDKFRTEIMDVIRDVKDQFEKLTFRIKEHQRKLNRKTQMEKEAEENYMKRLETYEKHRKCISQVVKLFRICEKKNEELHEAILQITDPTLFDKIKNFFGNKSYERELAVKEEKVRVLRQEFEELNKSLFVTAEDMCKILEVPKPTPNDTTKSSIVRCVQNATEKNPYPVYKSPLSCVENVEENSAKIQGSIENLKYQIGISEREKKGLEEQKKKMIMQLGLVKKDAQKNLKLLEDLQAFENKCAELTENSSNSKVHEDLEPIVDGICAMKLGETRQRERLLNLFFNAHEPKAIHKALKVDVHAMIKNRSEELNNMIQGLMNQAEKMNKDMEAKKQEIDLQSKKSERLRSEVQSEEWENSRIRAHLSDVYNENEHDAAMDKYRGLDEGRIRSFDLALIALNHEVEVIFHTDVIKTKDRIAASTSLNLCLKREKNRCERALSEHFLPVFSKRAEILENLKEHDAVIVVAHTGSGKSTQVPQYLADDLHNILQIGNRFPTIACTQPRRVACIRIAERVSQEYAGSVGLPPPKDSKTDDNKKSERWGSRRVAAYPLYASLDQPSQDRALDCDDIVGYDKEKFTQPTKQAEQSGQKNDESDLAGTPGEVGQWIGFHIGSKGKSYEEKKNSRKVCKGSRVHFVTEGLLLQKLRSTENSVNYNCIIIDEAHERGKDTDLILAHLHEILKKSKEAAYKGTNLKIVVMSASINKEAFSDYFGKCPIVECDGKMHDVELNYLPPPIPQRSSGTKESDSSKNGNDDSDYDETWEEIESNASTSSISSIVSKTEKPKKKSEMQILIEHAVNVIFNIILLDETPGHVLVFLPGQGEIHTCIDLINERAEKEIENTSGDECYVTKKVVCCTNIAETSLTIPGVKYVLDAGKAKKIKYNHWLRLTTLKLTDISRASAKQRKGRAGRVAPGICYRLYSEEHEMNKMAEYDDPQMKETPIDELYLYALDVCKGLEEIELMEDAKLSPGIIQTAKKRLVNLQFVKDGKHITITTEGKFALSLSGDVTLEGSKMILEAKKYEVVYDALYLSVLMSQDINDLQAEENYEKRAYYTDELGDHLTNLNLYKHFHQKIKSLGKERTMKWCKQLGLSYGILEQIPKAVNRVYEGIKRENKFNIAEIFKESREKEKSLRQKKKISYTTECLVQKREELMKAIVCGYFHNIAFLNDPEYVKSGYSLATPSNYGDKSSADMECGSFTVRHNDSTENFDLLKLKISKESTLNELGDVLKNTPTIFHTLFEPKDGFVLMKSCSRIKAEWIEECGGKDWKNSIGLSKCNEQTINQIVKQFTFEHIGPRILAKLVKEPADELDDEIKQFVEQNASKEVDQQTKAKELLKMKFLQVAEKISNGKVRNLFEMGEVKIYGSPKELKKIYRYVNPKIDEIKSLTLGEDSVERFPNPDSGLTEICTIESGLMINNISTPPRPQIFTQLDEVMSSTLILHKDVQSKSYIEQVVAEISQTLPDDLHEVWEQPYITCNENKQLSWIKFTRRDVANYFENVLKNKKLKYFSASTKCFFDKHLQITVSKTSLYPSVVELADAYPNLKVVPMDRKNHGFFKVELEKNAPRNADTEIERFINDLVDAKVFGSKLIEDLDTRVPHGIKEYIYWKIKKSIDDLEDRYNVQIKHRKFPTMVFEIFGEYNERKELATYIKNLIEELKHDIVSENSKYTRTYSRKIKLTSRHMLAPALKKIKELRENNENVKITIAFIGEHGDKNIPVAHLICENADDGRKAKDEILQCCSEKTGIVKNDPDVPICCICTRRVFIPNSSKQKKRERQELKATREEKGAMGKVAIKSENEEGLPKALRLILCGCTYCKDCFIDSVRNNLDEQAVNGTHEPVNCFICDQAILMSDIKYLNEKPKEYIFKQVLKNYFSANNTRVKHFDQCGNCKTLLLLYHTDYGVYKCYNKKCMFSFCCQCKRRVMSNNEADFKYHEENCWKKYKRPSYNQSRNIYNEGLNTTHYGQSSDTYNAFPYNYERYERETYYR